jgi:hypothetical protein
MEDSGTNPSSAQLMEGRQDLMGHGLYDMELSNVDKIVIVFQRRN